MLEIEKWVVHILSVKRDIEGTRRKRGSRKIRKTLKELGVNEDQEGRLIEILEVEEGPPTSSYCKGQEGKEIERETGKKRAYIVGLLENVGGCTSQSQDNMGSWPNSSSSSFILFSCSLLLIRLSPITPIINLEPWVLPSAQDSWPGLNHPLTVSS